MVDFQVFFFLCISSQVKKMLPKNRHVTIKRKTETAGSSAARHKPTPQYTKEVACVLVPKFMKLWSIAPPH